jgi:hypothetical protein
MDSIEACPKCGSSINVRKKTVLIGRASPNVLFSEERAGYRRKDQIAVDECKPEKIGNAPLEQFVDGYYCFGCDLGFVSDKIRAKHDDPG